MPRIDAPAYWVSRGTETAEGTIVFYDDGRWTEFTRQQTVPVAAASATLREFFETGQRPRAIDWTEV